MRKLGVNHVWLDMVFPTAVRYAGLAVMVYATVVDKVERPSLLVAATGMILFKTVLNGKNGKPAAEETEEPSKEDRWSHLP